MVLYPLKAVKRCLQMCASEDQEQTCIIRCLVDATASVKFVAQQWGCQCPAYSIADIQFTHLLTLTPLPHPDKIFPALTAATTTTATSAANAACSCSLDGRASHRYDVVALQPDVKRVVKLAPHTTTLHHHHRYTSEGNEMPGLAIYRRTTQANDLRVCSRLRRGVRTQEYPNNMRPALLLLRHGGSRVERPLAHPGQQTPCSAPCVVSSSADSSST
mmetsp:Transcript_22273/g.54806  ORF Transcript_22273/g.54806 Transcript_22273/m.54806 type:complete len:217 (-) Transcript_22273:4116-4766(-)